MPGASSTKPNITSQLSSQSFNPFLPMTQGPNTAAGIYDPPPYTPEQEHDVTPETLKALFPDLKQDEIDEVLSSPRHRWSDSTLEKVGDFQF